MNKLFALLVLASAGGLGLPALAATFHVAREAPGASDTNDGLSPIFISGNRGPWKTLTRAGRTARGNDTVLVYRGDYRNEQAGFGRGVIPIENSGAAEARIRFVGVAGPRPVVNTMLVHGREWIEIRGFTFVSPHFELPGGWSDMPNIVVDDPSIVIDPAEPWATREPKVRQKYATYMAMVDFFRTAFTSGVDVRDSRHILLRNNDLRFYTYGIQIADRSSDIRVEGNRFSYCMEGIFTWEADPSISDSVIRGNVFHQNFNNGMMVRETPTRVLIEDNDLRFSGTSHITLLNGGTACTIRGNTAQFGGYYTETMEFPGSTAINVHTSHEGNVVEGNFAAYHIDLTTYDGNGYTADLMWDGAGVTFRNNIAYRNMGSGIRTIESPNCTIVNNTLVENGYMQADPLVGSGVSLARAQDVGHTIGNNLLVDNLTAGIKSLHTLDEQQRIDHNHYRAANGAPYVWDSNTPGEAEFGTLPEIRANTDWETHGVDGAPRFVNRIRLNFRLRAASPSVDAGRTIPFVPLDFDGSPRPRGQQYDIGAFESH